MKKSRTTDRRIRRGEHFLDREATAHVSKRSSRPSGIRVQRLLFACVLLLVVGGGCLYAYRWYVRSHQERLAVACRQARVEGNWPQLELLAREWAVWQPNQFEPWLLAADAAKQMGNSQRASDYLSNLPDTAPVEAFHELGRLQMDVLNQPLSAVETCKHTLGVHPEDPQSHQRLLSFYAMTCQRDELAQEARRAIRVGSDSLATYAYLVAAKWLTLANGYAVNKKWLVADPNDELFTVASVIHLIAHREEIAPSHQAGAEDELVPMERYEQMVTELGKRYPKNVELLACRCNLLCQSAQIVDVAKILAQAPAETENDSRFWRFKGWYHSAREQWPEAKAAYERALQLWPFDWMSQHELAIVLRRSGSLNEASKIQELATLGKEVMGDILQAPRLDASSRDTFARISDYLRLCGDAETAQSLRQRLEQARK